jgi:hypothetical protein
VDEIQQAAMFLWRTPSGSYRQIKPSEGVLLSRTLAGFWLRTEWLWQQPRPKKIALLAEILKG